MMRLSKTEKDEIAKLYKCRRAIEEEELQDRLNIERTTLTQAFDKTISDLKEELEREEKNRQELLKDHGYANMDRYGCMRSHPELDIFRAETNEKLMKLWGGEVNIL